MVREQGDWSRTEKSARGLAVLHNLAEQAGPGKRFASWTAEALYRFGTGRELTLIHRAGTRWKMIHGKGSLPMLQTGQKENCCQSSDHAC